MKSNTKFLWVYMIVLFALAFVLIFVSAIGQSRANQNVATLKEQLEEKQTFYEGAQKSLSNITEENTYLKSENERLSEELSAAKEKLEETERETSVSLIKQRNSRELLAAQRLYNEGKAKECREALLRVVIDLLEGDEREIYQFLEGHTK